MLLTYRWKCNWGTGLWYHQWDVSAWIWFVFKPSLFLPTWERITQIQDSARSAWICSTCNNTTLMCLNLVEILYLLQGDYTVTLEGKSNEGKPLFCTSLTVEVKWTTNAVFHLELAYNFCFRFSLSVLTPLCMYCTNLWCVPNYNNTKIKCS